jgi:hypothetical protein
MFIWEFRQATRMDSKYAEYSLNRHDVKDEYFSSLAKCRKEVKKRVKKLQLEIKSEWTEENWIKEDEWCVVYNLGGNNLFSFTKIEVL